jgi:hypothetical protein
MGCDSIIREAGKQRSRKTEKQEKLLYVFVRTSENKSSSVHTIKTGKI